MKKADNILSVLPLVLAFFFFIIGSIGELPFFMDMEIGKLTVLNLILSYIFLFAMRYFEFVGRLDVEAFVDRLLSKSESEMEPEEMPAEKEGDIPPPPAPEEFVEIHAEDEKEPLPKLMQSIESNCKTLNSVIGRVYRKSNGGNRLIRDIILIKKEWYNEFNTLVNTLEKDKILEVVDKIEKRLNTLFRSEKELFGKKTFKNLKKDPDGKSRAIDVLIMNDNDPVETYFENALILCGKVREKLKRM